MSDQLQLLPIGSILAGLPGQNVRRHFDQEDLERLAQSIRELGILEPLIVTPADTDSDAEGHFVLVAGERRLRAATMAGLETVPAIVRELAPADAAKVMLLENLQRKDLDPIEEAEGYERLIQEHGLRARAIAKELGISEAHISNRRRLLKLPESARENISRGKLSASVAAALLSIAEYPDITEKAAQALIDDGATQANAERKIGDWLASRGKCPIVASQNSYSIASCDPESHQNCPCRRKVTREYGGQVAVCIDHARYAQVEAEAQARIDERAQKEADAEAQASDGIIDIGKGKWRSGSYGEKALYRNLIQGQDKAPGLAERHAACACRRAATEHGHACTICIKPREFDKIENAATRARNRQLKEDLKEELQEARLWSAQRQIDTWHDVVGQPVVGKEELSYLAATVITHTQIASDRTGKRRIERNAYLRELGLEGEQSRATGPVLARYLTGLPAETLWRAIFEWPLLAGNQQGWAGPTLSQWYRRVVESGLHDDTCDICGGTKPIEVLKAHQVRAGSSSGLPVGTWAVICSSCDHGNEFRWRGGLTPTTDEDLEPGERIRPEQVEQLKARMSGSVGGAPAAHSEDDEEDEELAPEVAEASADA